MSLRHRRYRARMPSRRTWVGGANLPTRYMRMNAPWPLARLTIDQGLIGIQIRPRLAARLTHADELSAAPDAVECVYAAVGKLFRGIGVRTTSGRDYYFRTYAGAEVLAAAHQAGFPVSGESRVPSKIWNPMP